MSDDDDLYPKRSRALVIDEGTGKQLHYNERVIYGSDISSDDYEEDESESEDDWLVPDSRGRSLAEEVAIEDRIMQVITPTVWYRWGRQELDYCNKLHMTERNKSPYTDLFRALEKMKILFEKNDSEKLEKI